MRGVGRGTHSEGGWGGGHTVRGGEEGTHSEWEWGGVHSE